MHWVGGGSLWAPICIRTCYFNIKLLYFLSPNPLRVFLVRAK